jgi:hypothetical protein
VNCFSSTLTLKGAVEFYAVVFIVTISFPFHVFFFCVCVRSFLLFCVAFRARLRFGCPFYPPVFCCLSCVSSTLECDVELVTKHTFTPLFSPTFFGFPSSPPPFPSHHKKQKMRRYKPDLLSASEKGRRKRGKHKGKDKAK